MLLSLLKILFFFAVVLVIALGAVHLSETGQVLRLEYAGTEYVLSPVKAVVALLVLMVLAWLVFKALGLFLAFIRFLAGDETAIDRYFARSRERKGYAALGEGMLAVASGEGKLAQDKAARAEKYLNMPHITNLLSAQAAEVAGDKARAGQVYRTLLEDDRTRFVGIRGLMRQKMDEGDTATALLLAQKAYALKPRHRELQDTLLDLEMRQHDWKGARQLLKDKRRQGDLPKEVHIRRDAVLALQEAREVLAQGNSISAREAAISAAKASPDLIPAAVLAARSYVAQKDYRNASRVLEKTWSVRPHPDVAAAYAEIVLEGHIHPGEMADEGPYGDHTGYYNEVDRFPVFTVERITHRKNPIYHSTYTGRPPDEPAILGVALNEVFVPILQKQFPEIVDFYLPPEGCSYRMAVVTMKKQYPGHAKRVMLGVWSFLRQFMYTKFVIVTDDDINARDWNDVIWAITTRMDPKRDTVMIDNTPIDYLDFASPISGLGSKMGLDATHKWPGETSREWGRAIVQDPAVKRRVDELWSQLGID